MPAPVQIAPWVGVDFYGHAVPGTGFQDLLNVHFITRPAQMARFDLNAAVNDVIAACDGDLRATARALVVANNFLLGRNETLIGELDEAWQGISPGYTRSTGRRGMKSGEPD